MINILNKNSDGRETFPATSLGLKLCLSLFSSHPVCFGRKTVAGIGGDTSGPTPLRALHCRRRRRLRIPQFRPVGPYLTSHARARSGERACLRTINFLRRFALRRTKGNKDNRRVCGRRETEQDARARRRKTRETREVHGKRTKKIHERG